MPSKKLNCWEFKKCERGPGGKKVAELGQCAASQVNIHGVNSGQRAGRACWAIAGTLCGGQVQGSFASKLKNCMECDFYKAVKAEEGKNCMQTSEILKKIK